MPRRLRLPGAVLLIGGGIVPAIAQAPAIDVKTGLWEVSSTRSSEGMPQMPAAPQIPPEVLAKMPPAQRAQIESAMRAAQQQATGGTSVKKACVTREALQRGLSFGTETRPSCKQTVQTHSRTRWEMELTCNERGGHQTVHVQYQAPRPDIINGTVEITMNNGGRRMSMKQVMRGRWLGPDCGNVKPK